VLYLGSRLRPWSSRWFMLSHGILAGRYGAAEWPLRSSRNQIGDDCCGPFSCPSVPAMLWRLTYGTTWSSTGSPGLRWTRAMIRGLAPLGSPCSPGFLRGFPRPGGTSSGNAPAPLLTMHQPRGDLGRTTRRKYIARQAQMRPPPHLDLPNCFPRDPPRILRWGRRLIEGVPRPPAPANP
jgi:hypothetical protein